MASPSRAARRTRRPAAGPRVAILLGSDSDLPVMAECARVLEGYGVSYEIRVLSAHRTPEETAAYAKAAMGRGIKVIIAGAGGAAHLAGVIAACTTLPVIGVPVLGKSMNGLDSLLSMVQMPPGIPVATVAINGGKNAGLLAVAMMALGDASLQEKLIAYRKKIAAESLAKNKQFEQG